MNVNLFQFCRMKDIIFFITWMLVFSSCEASVGSLVQSPSGIEFPVCGDEQMELYLPMLIGKRVAIVANHTAQIKGVHLVDTLLRRNIQVIKVFAPEHGFRGAVPAGEKVESGKDPSTGVLIVSLYGQHEAPSEEDLSNVDVVLFDIQDVGVRFYTYLSTMKYVMESCNQFKKPMIILDRPNPNAHYVDGPVLKMKFRSMVGAIPVPVVHGCTLGEISKMIIGEGWLKGAIQPELFSVISCKNYNHQMVYSLEVPPSPNLSSDCAIQWYPSLCFFEGTMVSVGRGTSNPFTCFGYPQFKGGDFSFTPVSISGKVNHPLYENYVCNGRDLSGKCQGRINQLILDYLFEVYQQKGKEMFSSPGFFDKLAGTDQLRLAMLAGKNEEQIRATWKSELDAYLLMRKKYLLYPEQ